MILPFFGNSLMISWDNSICMDFMRLVTCYQEGLAKGIPVNHIQLFTSTMLK